jgi:hypothetical protein
MHEPGKKTGGGLEKPSPPHSCSSFGRESTFKRGAEHGQTLAMRTKVAPSFQL